MTVQKNTLRQAQREEAVKRLISLHLHGNVTREFQNGKLYLSERQTFGEKKRAFGILYWLNDEEKQKVKDFEDEHGALVYHVIKNLTEFGEQLSFLYVSKYKEEWDVDKQEMKDGVAMAYVTDGWCGEIGRIGFKESGGGLIRTC